MRGNKKCNKFFWGGYLLEGKLLTNGKISDFVVASKELKW